MTDEVTYKLLKAIEKCSKTNQRKLAEDLGVSLGRVNFFLNELVEKGLVEVSESTTNKRRACLYNLTAAGYTERAAVTQRYLNHLIEARKRMNDEIDSLKNETAIISKALRNSFSNLYANVA